MLRASLILVTLGGTALAEPVTFTVGLGPRAYDREYMQTVNEPGTTELEVSVTAAARITPTLAAGVRAAVASSRDVETAWWGMRNSENRREHVTPLEAALVVQKRFGRVWIAPWVGLNTMRVTAEEWRCSVSLADELSCSDPSGVATDWTYVQPAAGLDVGVDVVSIGKNHLGFAVSARAVDDESSAGIDLVFRR